MLKRLQSSNKGSDSQIQAKSAFVWLDFASRKCPTIFKSHVGELVRILNGAVSGGGGSSATSVKEGDEKVVEIALHALSKMSKADPGTAPEK